MEKKGELTSMRQKCLDIENDIKQLQNEKTDKLDLFGTDTRRVIKSINENIKKFKTKPIGPLGAEIKLKEDISPEVAAIIESELFDILGAFIVDNFDDKRTLDSLQEKLKTQSRVIKSGCGFQHEKYEISQGRCYHNQFSTIYDYIVSDHNVVINTLVDLKNGRISMLKIFCVGTVPTC